VTTGLGRRIILLAGAAVAIAPTVAGEERGRQRWIAVIAGAPRRKPNWVAFQELLPELGYSDGDNLAIDFLSRAGEMTPTALKDAIADSIRHGAEVIVTGGPERVLRAAVEATHAVPIVIVAIDYDPIAKGYIASLARPGGNVTGVFSRQLELSRKRLELFREAAPPHDAHHSAGGRDLGRPARGSACQRGSNRRCAPVGGNARTAI
jgi:putative ABC transport system substrate-binding protein